jgi:hypothetical protein
MYDFLNNTLNNFQNNTIYCEFNNNVIQNHFEYNNLKNLTDPFLVFNFTYNNINGFKGNGIQQDYNYNVITNAFVSNTTFESVINNRFYGLTMGNAFNKYFENNTCKKSFSSNVLYACETNEFNSFSVNTLSDDSDKIFKYNIFNIDLLNTDLTTGRRLYDNVTCTILYDRGNGAVITLIDASSIVISSNLNL